MTATITRPSTAPISPTPPPHRGRLAVAIAAAVLVAAAIGATLVLTLGGSSGNSSAETSYAYYQSMMGRFDIGGGSMMGGSDYGWMMGNSGYGWMMGGASVAPQWMQGQRLPGFIMRTSTDRGQVMGRLFAGAPGPRVSPSEAVALGNQVPAGAMVAKSANRITFAGSPMQLTVVASPPGNPDETFRVAGLVNPTIVVPRGARVTLTLVNADPDTAHGLVVTSTNAASYSFMPMMTATEAFPGAAVWFLGNPTSAGMHEGSMTFTASTTGTYQYLCPVPGHAQKGMAGSFVVQS
jgi:rusticyanin